MSSAYSFSLTKVMLLRIQLLTFKQHEVSLRAVWSRFMHMATSGPPHSILEDMLMQHFIGGLKTESAHLMNVASEGTIMYELFWKKALTALSTGESSTFHMSQLINPRRISKFTSYQLHPLHLHHT
jgi:hypothetical protein